MRDEEATQIDGELASRLGRMSGGSQRWLKTVLQTISANDEMLDVEQEDGTAGERAATRPAISVDEPLAEMAERRPADLEDVLMGRVDLAEQLAEYPELAEELEGLSEIIDILRDAGARRRRRGEEILRREILGEEIEDEPAEEGDEDDWEPLF